MNLCSLVILDIIPSHSAASHHQHEALKSRASRWPRMWRVRDNIPEKLRRCSAKCIDDMCIYYGSECLFVCVFLDLSIPDIGKSILNTYLQVDLHATTPRTWAHKEGGDWGINSKKWLLNGPCRLTEVNAGTRISHQVTGAILRFVLLIGIGKIGNCQQESADVQLAEIHLVQRLQHAQMARTLSSLNGLSQISRCSCKNLSGPNVFPTFETFRFPLPDLNCSC